MLNRKNFIAAMLGKRIGQVPLLMREGFEGGKMPFGRRGWRKASTAG